MEIFISAALPWILAGIAASILCVKLEYAEKNNSEKTDQRLAIGVAIGLVLGVALNSTGLWDSHGLGLTVGPLWGMALAALYDDAREHKKC